MQMSEVPSSRIFRPSMHAMGQALVLVCGKGCRDCCDLKDVYLMSEEVHHVLEVIRARH